MWSHAQPIAARNPPRCGNGGYKERMTRQAITVIYIIALVVVIVGVDVVFFRQGSWFWERLAANIGIVLLFGAFYFRFVRGT